VGGCQVEWTPKALDLLDGLETEAQERLVAKLDEAQDWTSHRLEKLSGYPYYKVRAGDYRAIITWNRDDDVLIVEAVGHRRNVYDRHLPP
jgi:mRNA interferase RelE/StbE